jgi:transcriptional regulator with XRE-family HTH domain
MRLTSATTLRALMEQKDVSYADMARAAGRSKGFISHLTSGRRRTCLPEVADRIARRLDVHLELLFVESLSTTTVRAARQQRRTAA